MAYMNQARKAERAGQVREICDRHGVKGSLSVRHNSTLVLTVKSGRINFFGDLATPSDNAGREMSVNVYWYRKHFTGAALAFLDEVIPALYGRDYYDRTDIQSDYFDCSHYIDVKIGRWDRPYELVK